MCGSVGGLFDIRVCCWLWGFCYSARLAISIYIRRRVDPVSKSSSTTMPGAAKLPGWRIRLLVSSGMSWTCALRGHLTQKRVARLRMCSVFLLTADVGAADLGFSCLVPGKLRLSGKPGEDFCCAHRRVAVLSSALSEMRCATL